MSSGLSYLITSGAGYYYHGLIRTQETWEERLSRLAYQYSDLWC